MIHNQPSTTDLMDDAIKSTQHYLVHMRAKIDDQFGEGYAESHPELLGSCISACAIEFATGILNQKSDEILYHLVQHYSQRQTSNDADVRGSE